MIGYFRDVYDAGLYVPASHLALIVTYPLVAFGQILGPLIAEYFYNDRLEKLFYLYRTATRWIFSISFPLFLLLLLFNVEVLRLFGEHYLLTWPVLIILSFGHLCSSIFGNINVFFSMTKYPGIVLFIAILSNIVNIVLNIILIPKLGILGAAIATAVSIIILNLLGVCFMVNKFKVNPFSLKMFKPFLSGVIAYCVLDFIRRFFYTDLTIEFLALSLLFFAVYFFILFAFRFEREDLELFKVVKARLVKNKG